VKGCGCRPTAKVVTYSLAGVRKPRKERAGKKRR